MPSYSMRQIVLFYACMFLVCCGAVFTVAHSILDDQNLIDGEFRNFRSQTNFRRSLVSADKIPLKAGKYKVKVGTSDQQWYETNGKAIHLSNDRNTSHVTFHVVGDRHTAFWIESTDFPLNYDQEYVTKHNEKVKFFK